MKITDIKLTIKHNLGNWEHCEFTAEAVIHDEDNLDDATKKLTSYVDWHAKKPTRDAQKKAFDAALADANTTEEKRAQAERWVAIYEARRAEVEGL